MKRLIIYHDDADGRCAAAIVHRDPLLRQPGVAAEITCVPMQYQDAVPWEAIGSLEKDQDECWILDFSFPLPVMRKIRCEVGRYVAWIDHHKTALAACGTLLADWPGLRVSGVAACLLTWRYLHPQQPEPLPVAYIADRDVWHFHYGDKTRWFHAAYLHHQDETHPASPLWDRWLGPEDARHAAELPALLAEGRLLHEHRINGLMAKARRLGYEGRLAGLPGDCTVLNINLPGSGDLGQIARDWGYDVCHCYVEEHDGAGHLIRNHTLYSARHDVGEYCRQRGGGGHRGAAGYVEVLS